MLRMSPVRKPVEPIWLRMIVSRIAPMPALPAKRPAWNETTPVCFQWRKPMPGLLGYVDVDHVDHITIAGGGDRRMGCGRRYFDAADDLWKFIKLALAHLIHRLVPFDVHVAVVLH